MARTPLRPAVPRAWLALGVSVGVHGLLLALLGFLPEGRRQADGPVAVSTVVLLSDEEAKGEGATPEPPRPAAPEGGEEQEPGFNPVVLPPAPVPVGPGDSAPEPTADVPGSMAGAPEGSAGGAAGRTGLTFFQVPAEGTRVVYVIDRSASMGLGDGLAAAKRELLASLRQLPASARFQVIFYSRNAEVLHINGRTDLVSASPDNIRETERLLQRLRAEGSTDHVPALRVALGLEPDVIFLVTDAADLSPEQVRRVTQWNGGRTAIHAIDLSGRDGAGGPLESLARSNRGGYRWVPGW